MQKLVQPSGPYAIYAVIAGDRVGAVPDLTLVDVFDCRVFMSTLGVKAPAKFDGAAIVLIGRGVSEAAFVDISPDDWVEALPGFDPRRLYAS